MTHGIYEGMWLKRLLNWVKIPVEDSMKMFYDNQVAISIAKNPVHHDWTKHVEIDRYFIMEKIKEGVISLVYIPTTLQIVNILTKVLS